MKIYNKIDLKYNNIFLMLFLISPQNKKKKQSLIFQPISSFSKPIIHLYHPILHDFRLYSFNKLKLARHRRQIVMILSFYGRLILLF